MKKLVPMFAAAFFALVGTSTNVFANPVIESAEFNSININLSRWQTDDDNDDDLFRRNWPPFGHHVVTHPIRLNGDLLNVRLAGSNELVLFISHTDIPELLSETDLSFPDDTVNVKWDEETNTIQILDSWFTEQPTIQEPIDMDTINPDEWIEFNFALSSNSNNFEESGYFFGAGGGGGILTVSTQKFDAETSHFGEAEVLFTTVIGCNTSEVRSIPRIVPENEDDIHRVAIFDIKFNIQDLKNLGSISEDWVERMLELRDTYETSEAMFSSVAFNLATEMITSGSFSDEHLATIIEAIELELSN